MASRGRGEKKTGLSTPIVRRISASAPASPQRNDSFHATKTPEEWGRQLLADEASRGNFLYHGQSPSKHSVYRLAWQQSAYVSKLTHTACLPRMVADVQRILDEFAPGCRLPVDAGNVTMNARHYAPPSNETCRLASLLYAEDVPLWRRRCGRGYTSHDGGG